MRAERALEIFGAVPLAPFTTLGVGGMARWFVTATTAAEVANGYDWAVSRGVPLFVLAGGSNVVIADDGFPGLVLRVAITGVTVDERADHTLITAGAGTRWDEFVDMAVARNLAGVECLSGIPGTVGGTPIQNVGAYGQDVSQAIDSVTAFDCSNRTLVTLTAAECDFSYRMSRFKSHPGRLIVTNVVFRLRRGEPSVQYPDLRSWLERAGIARPTLLDVRRAVIAVRQSKGMVVDADDPDSRSVGSFFMNPIVDIRTCEAITRTAGEAPPTFAVGEAEAKVPAAWLIERAGFRKGHIDGTVGISTKHPLAIVNRGSATARDVLRLATHIKREVADRFSVSLRPEPIFVGFADDPDVTYLQHQ